MINSKLDTDLYKLTMQQAVVSLYPRAKAVFKFINRNNTAFPEDFASVLRMDIDDFANIRLTDKEDKFLRQLPYFTPAYLDFFRGFKYNPKEVKIEQNGGELRISIIGLWYSAMMWEVPLMAIISERYFETIDLDYNHGDLNKKDIEKGRQMKINECLFADFGTRRRYSVDNHFRVVQALESGGRPSLVGTSNLHIAHSFGLTPVGTQAHEWFQFHAAKFGPIMADEMALEQWVRVYEGDLGIALSDTFTTPVFLKAFNKKYAKLFDGVRHDSGDPFAFIDTMVQHYRKLRIDPMSKTIVFSDGLNVDKAIQLNNACAGRIKCSFGIGTNLSNDVGVKPLNMVIKMVATQPDNGEFIPTVKLSDTEGKHTGVPSEIELYKRILRI